MDHLHDGLHSIFDKKLQAWCWNILVKGDFEQGNFSVIYQCQLLVKVSCWFSNQTMNFFSWLLQLKASELLLGLQINDVHWEKLQTLSPLGINA
jgi:hypothetical protein